MNFIKSKLAAALLLTAISFGVFSLRSATVAAKETTSKASASLSAGNLLSNTNNQDPPNWTITDAYAAAKAAHRAAQAAAAKAYAAAVTAGGGCKRHLRFFCQYLCC